MKLQRAPASENKHADDDQAARWGRTQHHGFRTGAYIQSPVILTTADHHPLWLGDMYRGRSIFVIAGGPSFGQLNHSLLRQPGVMTMGINNSPRSFRPDLWTCVDNPQHFIRSIWTDPKISKFAPLDHANKKLFNSDTWTVMDMEVQDCPNVSYYRRNEKFRAKQFLWEDTLNWGNHGDWGGGRSVFLPTIRILFYLGFRKIFLLGVDFDMSTRTTYHFEQARALESVNSNAKTYGLLCQRFKELRPLFEREGFHIYNCNAASKLDAFDHVPFVEAVGQVVKEFGDVDVSKERTSGLYEREAKPRAPRRKVEVQDPDGGWREILFKKLRPPDRFRMFEPSGTPVHELGCLEWIVTEKPKKQPDGTWTVQKKTP